MTAAAFRLFGVQRLTGRLELQRYQIPDEPPGRRVWNVKTGTMISETASGYWEKVEREIAALKERIGFVPGDIAVRKFDSEEASIEELPGEYQHFLENREAYSEED